MVAALGLGLAALGRPAYITTGREADLPTDRPPAAMRSRTHEMLDAAAHLGIRYVDAARGYGAAEDLLADWLAGAAAIPFVASKWGYRYTADWRPDATRHEVKDHSPAMLEQQWAETTDRLGRWLRLYQVHSLTVDSPLFDDRTLLDRLGEIRVQGVELGFSTSGPEQAAAIARGLDLTVDGVPLFTSVQSTWNLLEPSAGRALAAAHDGGARVVVKEALANGLLAGHPALQDAEPADRIALGAALAQPWADVVLTGAVTVPQLESNVAATRLTVDADAFRDVATAPEAYWAARSRRSWS
jgi:aryl-alcohol dehydrogenase-like predicted oxidoreductase